MNKNILRTISLLMVISLTFGKFTFGQAKSERAATASTFLAEADSRVQEAKPDNNYGTYGTTLYVEGGADPDAESYFRFTVAGISGTVTSAKLRVYITDGASSGPAVYTTSNAWVETAITWNNRPARAGNGWDDKGALAANTWAEYDVTPFVPGPGTYSFVLATDSTDSLALTSREGTYPPQLIVTVSDGATNTPLPPASPTPTTVPATQVVPPTSTPAAPAVGTTPLPTFTTVPPSATPTTLLPSPTTILPTATSTSVAKATVTSTPQTTTSGAVSSGSMWISPSELMSLPTSGAAWDKLRSTAYGSWGTADLKNQDNKHDIYVLAGALVYARTGDAALRSKVRDAIIAAKRSMDESSEWQTTNGVLAAGRQLGAYVISADLINLKSFDTAADNEFRSWLSSVRTTDIGTHGRWKNIRFTCENATANWSAFACASRIAASIYLGDTADVKRSANIIRALFGERNYYPPDAPGSNGYFQHTAAYQISWTCNEATWTGINPPCMKSGVNLDGVILEDVSRGGGCCIAQGAGISYSWESLQGFFVSAELLYRTGAYGDPYSWSNQALKRAMDFMQRSGWGISNVSAYVPWMANFRYRTSYPVTAVVSGRVMSWGDWLYKR